MNFPDFVYLFFSLIALAVVVGLTIILMWKSCQVKQIDCKAGICNNDFGDYKCECQTNAFNKNETDESRVFNLNFSF